MRLISWNVNGFRAALGKGFEEFFETFDADIFSLQETKMQPGQAVFEPAGYHQYWNSADKKGYSGTAVFSKEEPLLVANGIGFDEKKPVIYCGDLNVAHQEIDLKNPGPNRGNPGFSDEERAKMSQLLETGFVDTFRALYPDTVAYSWWSYRFQARANNAGWRIDYFLVSKRLLPAVEDSLIYPEVTGSDHCPVGIELDLDKIEV